MFMGIQARGFSTSAAAFKVGCAMVKPVHHRVKINKQLLSPRFPELKLDPKDIKSPKFKPTLTRQDRVKEHYFNTLQSDLLLINYVHEQREIIGFKRRKWDMSSPYHINRPLKKPVRFVVPTPNIKVRNYKNIPMFKGVTINCYAASAKTDPAHGIAASLQVQQITGVRPKNIYAKTNVPSWGLRPGMRMGAKVFLTNDDASQFISTLTEFVLPKIRDFEGISNKSGDRFGNITFGLTPAHIKFFPEIELNQTAWPITFGMHITLHTTAQIDAEARILLSGLGLPFTGPESVPKYLIDDSQQRAYL